MTNTSDFVNKIFLDIKKNTYLDDHEYLTLEFTKFGGKYWVDVWIRSNKFPTAQPYRKSCGHTLHEALFLMQHYFK